MDGLARAGRAYGVHLVLAGAGELGLSARGCGHRDSVLGQFPVRVALPGGSAVLEPTNDSAAGLPVGSAVVNTAGGLGGPRGATRGHERMIRLPDPQDHPDGGGGAAARLWAARPDGSVPPVVFAGYARPLLRNDPRHRAASGRAGARTGGPAGPGGGRAPARRSPYRWVRPPGATWRCSGPGPRRAGCWRRRRGAPPAHHPPGTARFLVAAPDPGAGAGGGVDCRVGRAGIRPSWWICRRCSRRGRRRCRRIWWSSGWTGRGLGSCRWTGCGRCCGTGPPAGRHLLGWWRTVPPFAALFGAGGRGRQAGRGGRAGRAGRAAHAGLRAAGRVAAPPGPGGALGRPGRAGHRPGAVRRRGRLIGWRARRVSVGPERDGDRAGAAAGRRGEPETPRRGPPTQRPPGRSTWPPPASWTGYAGARLPRRVSRPGRRRPPGRS